MRSRKSLEGNDIIRRIINGFIKVSVVKFMKVRATGFTTLTVSVHDSRSVFQKSDAFCE